MGLTLGVGVLALSALIPSAGSALASSMRSAIVGADPHASNAALVAQIGGGLGQAFGLMLPLALLVMAAGIGANLVAGGLVLSPQAIRFDGSRLNPVAGMRRLIDQQALVRLGISAAKLAVLAFVSWQVLSSRVPAILATGGSSIVTITGSAMSAIFELGLALTVLLAGIALVDFVVQRRRAMGQLKMTKEEVRREFKDAEGDPLIRGARKRRARQLAFARMMDAIPTADVVVTNPTHLAVALKYDSLTMKAPRIVAKGQRLMAQRIKEIARANRVPIVEDKPLARALFPRPLGAEVPPHLYRAVARLLVIVHQARFARPAPTQRRPVAPSAPRLASNPYAPQPPAGI